QQILDALWPLLKPGGIMLYSTCSILRSENSEQISAFLQRHKDARLEEITSGEPESLENRNTIPGWQILPGESEMDGFYYAKLHKVAV
ncbi:MAG: 16S rRNA (cytosine(967)-C(5))-methyltransferase, partial [Gammaproteobacteria bacterium]|nr:16S rRNA (cytosine(967)-C(5))-methyltransferase [Gammaproteobacteria bacterium]